MRSIVIRLGAADSPNWNSYGGLPTTPEAMATASALVGVPTTTGGMQLEIHAGGSSVEIEISADGTISSVLWERA